MDKNKWHQNAFRALAVIGNEEYATINELIGDTF